MTINRTDYTILDAPDSDAYGNASDHTPQLSAVEPQEATLFTRVDIDITGSAIRVSIHRRSATGAAEMPLGIRGIARADPAGEAVAMHAQSFHQVHQTIHGDQHAMTALAVSERMRFERAVREGLAAEGTFLRRLAEHEHTIGLRRRKRLDVAVVADIDATLHIRTQSGAAVLAFHFHLLYQPTA